MRELVGGKNTIGRMAAVLKSPMKRPLPLHLPSFNDLQNNSHKYYKRICCFSTQLNLNPAIPQFGLWMVWRTLPYPNSNFNCFQHVKEVFPYFQCRTNLAVFTYVSVQPRGLVFGASDYWSRGPGFDSRLYHGNFPCGGRIPVVTMVWVVSRFRLKVDTSSTRSQTSINSDWTYEISSLEGTSSR